MGNIAAFLTHDKSTDNFWVAMSSFAEGRHVNCDRVSMFILFKKSTIRGS